MKNQKIYQGVLSSLVILTTILNAHASSEINKFNNQISLIKEDISEYRLKIIQKTIIINRYISVSTIENIEILNQAKNTIGCSDILIAENMKNILNDFNIKKKSVLEFLKQLTIQEQNCLANLKIQLDNKYNELSISNKKGSPWSKHQNIIFVGQIILGATLLFISSFKERKRKSK